MFVCVCVRVAVLVLNSLNHCTTVSTHTQIIEQPTVGDAQNEPNKTFVKLHRSASQVISNTRVLSHTHTLSFRRTDGIYLSSPSRRRIRSHAPSNVFFVCCVSFALYIKPYRTLNRYHTIHVCETCTHTMYMR